MYFDAGAALTGYLTGLQYRQAREDKQRDYDDAKEYRDWQREQAKAKADREYDKWKLEMDILKQHVADKNKMTIDLATKLGKDNPALADTLTRTVPWVSGQEEYAKAFQPHSEGSLDFTIDVPENMPTPRSPNQGASEHPLFPGAPTENMQFAGWYDSMAQANNLDRNPNDPRHYYDYRAYFDAERPQMGDFGTLNAKDGRNHFPDTYKVPGHPSMGTAKISASGGWQPGFSFARQAQKPTVSKEQAVPIVLRAYEAGGPDVAAKTATDLGYPELGAGLPQTGTQGRHEDNLSLRKHTAALSTFTKMMPVIKDALIDGQGAQALGEALWNTLIANDVIPKDTPQPNWAKVAEEAQVDKRYDRFVEQARLALSGMGLQKSIDEYIANSSDPTATYTPQPVIPVTPDGALPGGGFEMPSGAPPNFGSVTVNRTSGALPPRKAPEEAKSPTPTAETYQQIRLLLQNGQLTMARELASQYGIDPATVKPLPAKPKDYWSKLTQSEKDMVAAAGWNSRVREKGPNDALAVTRYHIREGNVKWDAKKKKFEVKDRDNWETAKKATEANYAPKKSAPKKSSGGSNITGAKQLITDMKAKYPNCTPAQVKAALINEFGHDFPETRKSMGKG